MSNFPISGSVRFALFPLHLCIGTDLELLLNVLRLLSSEALPLSVLTSYSWSGCGCASLGKAFTVAVACGVNSGAEESFCGGPEFYAVKCRPGPSKFLASSRTCYGIATPVSGVTDPGNLHFVLRPIGSGAQAVTPALEFLRRGRRLFRGPLRRPRDLFPLRCAGRPRTELGRAMLAPPASARGRSPASLRRWGSCLLTGGCQLSGLVPHPSFGPADPFASGRSVAVASQAAGDTAAVFDQRSAAREGGSVRPVAQSEPRPAPPRPAPIPSRSESHLVTRSTGPVPPDPTIARSASVLATPPSGPAPRPGRRPIWPGVGVPQPPVPSSAVAQSGVGLARGFGSRDRHARRARSGPRARRARVRRAALGFVSPVAFGVVVGLAEPAPSGSAGGQTEEQNQSLMTRMAALEARSAAGPRGHPCPEGALCEAPPKGERSGKLQAAGLAALVDYSEFGLDVAFDEAVYPPDYIAAVRAAVGPVRVPNLHADVPPAIMEVNARP
ncbi:hypothetical protein PAPYR_7661 [Paratrimastix pyriformis]|uniref:Uncharacterized protein n=1 Tax=Paratrimastix pyriformis TaxID=342808 RepID=A0ABQ8UCL8_9EUKA|nr:hypothetical protein PAPYR_7661 [Paratrimastix pyriformis]